MLAFPEQNPSETPPKAPPVAFTEMTAKTRELACVQTFARTHSIKPCEAIARMSGFTSYEQYRQAKIVVECGAPELIEAMDQERIAIHNAAFLAKHTTQRIQAAVVKPEHSKRDISRIVGETRGGRSTIPAETAEQAVQALLRNFSAAEIREALDREGQG